jgi:hypothetical protein
MSASPPKADMCGATNDVGYGPIADISVPKFFRDLAMFQAMFTAALATSKL